MAEETGPIFTAVSNNAHQLYTLLHCIGFAQNATVQITPDGIRFSVEEARVVQGLAFLDKALFTTYTFNPTTTPSNEGDVIMEDIEPDGSNYPCFVVSLSALLETLKIFGVGESSSTSASRAASVQPSTVSASSAFTAPALLLNRSCTFQYSHYGSSLSITLAETGVKTVCEYRILDNHRFVIRGRVHWRVIQLQNTAGFGQFTLSGCHIAIQFLTVERNDRL